MTCSGVYLFLAICPPVLKVQVTNITLGPVWGGAGHRDKPYDEAVEGIAAGLQETPRVADARDGFQPMVQAIVAASRQEPLNVDVREVMDMTCALTGKVCRTCEGVRCVPPSNGTT